MVGFIEAMKENEKAYAQDLQFFTEESEKLTAQFNQEVSTKQREVDRLNSLKDELFEKLKSQEATINAYVVREDEMKQEIQALKTSKKKSDIWDLIAAEKKRNEDLLKEVLDNY